jgi:hypothetical protein
VEDFGILLVKDDKLRFVRSFTPKKLFGLMRNSLSSISATILHPC